MKKRGRETLAPDLTPLIDLIFLLLIFFLVTSVFRKDELALMLNLPVAQNGSENPNPQKNLVIEISEQALAVNGKKIEVSNLSTELKTFTDKTVPVEVRIDKTVRYEKIISVFDLLKAEQLFNLNLVTNK